MALRVANAIDLHCHYGPDTSGADLSRVMTNYGVTALEAVREAAASGHAAIVLKSHSFASPALASALDEAVPGIAVFGGICTDFPTGGLSVAAVEAALAMGAKIVWLPTVHSSEDVSRGRRPYLAVPGIDVIGDDRRPVAEVREIADLVRAADAILATGHTSALEHYAVVKEFARHTKVLVTHAGEALAGPQLSPAQSAGTRGTRGDGRTDRPVLPDGERHPGQITLRDGSHDRRGRRRSVCTRDGLRLGARGAEARSGLP